MVRATTYVVVLGVVAGFYWAYRQAYYSGAAFPYNTFLFEPENRFHDLRGFFGPLDANDPYAVRAICLPFERFGSLCGSAYPPFSFIVMEPFSWLGDTWSVVALTVLVIAGLGAFMAWELDFVPLIDRSAAVVVVTVVTYPFLFAFDRANIEVVVTLLLAASVWALQTSRYDVAAVAIGGAAAIKVFPLVFVVLFLIWRLWRPLFITLATTFALTFFGSIYYSFDLPFTLDRFRQSVHYFNETYVIRDAGLGWGMSLFGPVKLLAVDVFGGSTQTVRGLLPAYTAISVILLLVVVAALWRLPLVFWEQITLLVLTINLLPAASTDYKLLHLVIPMALFLRGGTDDRWRWWYLAGFAALMVPKAYVVLRPEGASLGVVLNPLIMLAMGTAIVVSGVGRRAALGHPRAMAPTT